MFLRVGHCGSSCTATVCKKVHQSDVLYATWLDDQIHMGNDAVKWHDSTVHDHPIPGKRCEVPEVVGPPISYMEKVKMFKPVRVRTQSKRALSILSYEPWEVPMC